MIASVYKWNDAKAIEVRKFSRKFLLSFLYVNQFNSLLCIVQLSTSSILIVVKRTSYILPTLIERKEKSSKIVCFRQFILRWSTTRNIGILPRLLLHTIRVLCVWFMTFLLGSMYRQEHVAFECEAGTVLNKLKFQHTNPWWIMVYWLTQVTKLHTKHTKFNFVYIFVGCVMWLYQRKP